MNTTNYIRIFRGDDSDAIGYQTIVGTIKTDVDLAGCKAVFRFLGFFAEFDPIPEDKKLTIVIPAQASRGFPPGVGYASLKVIDALGKIRTFTNRIPVIVDTMTPSCSGGEFEVSFSPFPNLEPLRIFMGPNAGDFDQYTGFISKTIDRASLAKYGLVMLADAMGEDGGASGKAASPLAVKAAYDAIIATLTDNYYTASETEEAIDRVAAYYITYDAAGNPFPTYAALANAQTVYSGGEVRVPTRNDYCVVLADETHGGSEYRYIYAVAEGETAGSWQPQFPVGGVMTVDQTVTKNSANPVSSGGIWSAIWGALASLPTGFTSLYDWCVSQLAGKASTADATLTPIYSDTPTFSEWTILRDGVDVTAQAEQPRWVQGQGIWYVYCLSGEDFDVYDDEEDRQFDRQALELHWLGYKGQDESAKHYTATRTRTDIIGYTLGSQTDKPLQPKGDYPTKAEMDEGWWSGTGVCTPSEKDGRPVIAATALVDNGYNPDDPEGRDLTGYWGVFYADDTTRDARESLAALKLPADVTGETMVWPAVDSWGSGVTATRHRVAAPVPTKPSDIGAAPATNIPKSALAQDVQTSLGKADTALQTAPVTSVNSKTGAVVLNASDVGAATRAANPTAGNLAALDAQGNPTDSLIPSANVAVKGNIPYDLVTKTIANGAVTLDDRASNAVAVSAALSPNTLTVNFPTATSGKVRDFALRLNIASGVTAPEIAWPQGVTLENDGGEVPEIADGGTGGSSTILYFSETENDGTTAKFLVKGETLTAIARPQA